MRGEVVACAGPGDALHCALMKLISWNVNGIRAVLKKGFEDFIHREQPDIVCLQETKATPEQVVVPQALAEYTSF